MTDPKSQRQNLQQNTDAISSRRTIPTNVPRIQCLIGGSSVQDVVATLS